MKHYRVIALYKNTPLERIADVEAEDPQQAMVKALLERRVPAAFVPDEYGWLQPVFWSASLGGAERWPMVTGPSEVAWGDRQGRNRLRFLVTEIVEAT